jgi:hypothetical protein
MLSTVNSLYEEKQVFRQLLCASYNRPYTIASVSGLHILVHLADFYCSLPIISATIISALLGSPMFKNDPDPESSMYNEFFSESCRLILVAQKLRHAVLFRECFIQVVGNFNDPLFMKHQIEDLRKGDALWNLLSAEYAELCRKILLADKVMILMVKVSDSYWHLDSKKCYRSTQMT